MERVLDKKMSKPPESDVEKTYTSSQNDGALTQEDFRLCGSRRAKNYGGLHFYTKLNIKTTADNRFFESSIKEYNNKQSQPLN